MITISGAKTDIASLASPYSGSSAEYNVLQKMNASLNNYSYDYIEQFKFELATRAAIQNSALALKDSGMEFAVFENSRCNTGLWNRTDNGGFRLKSKVLPSKAIQDIFENGDAYATECATAISIIYYKALLAVYGEESFNKIFPSIYLMDWDIQEPLLVKSATIFKPDDVFISDRGYFINPEYDPELPQWQGENVIIMADNMFFGHGIGYADADYMIDHLNSRRKAGATVPAYLLDKIGRPDFKKLANALYKPKPAPLVWRFPPRS